MTCAIEWRDEPVGPKIETTLLTKQNKYLIQAKEWAIAECYDHTANTEDIPLIIYLHFIKEKSKAIAEICLSEMSVLGFFLHTFYQHSQETQINIFNITQRRWAEGDLFNVQSTGRIIFSYLNQLPKPEAFSILVSYSIPPCCPHVNKAMVAQQDNQVHRYETISFHT